mmetsp:Transcript_63543/g.151551  ORF Transcript_63543/g.151551 Transcript_63543/m.151551 type:complete len:545 (+) Transcript_63543:54-1688(+)
MAALSLGANAPTFISHASQLSPITQQPSLHSPLETGTQRHAVTSRPSSSGTDEKGWRSFAAVAVSVAGLQRCRKHRGTRPTFASSAGSRFAGVLRSVKVLATSETTEAGSHGSGDIRKWLTFWSCFFGYSVCYFTRQSLNYTAPVLQQAMGWQGLAQLGQLTSIFPLAYGSSRFLGGVLGDRMSPRKVFALGLTICGGLNVAFGLSSSLPFFVLFWFLNGCFQGLAAPPCVKMITNWFSPKERGQWWSIWHASINLGGFLIPFLAGSLAENFGWRYGMLGPGVLALATAFICFTLMRDGPTKVVKSETIEATEGDKPKTVEAPEDAQVGIVEGLLMDPVQWALGLGYLLVYVARYGLSSWGVFYLLHSGTGSAAKAAALLSGFELGGFIGNLSGGKLSDVFVQMNGDEDTSPGQRAKVVGLFFAAALALIPLFALCPASLPWAQYLLLLGIGHFLSGAQLLLPLVAAEVAPKSLLATATGFIGWVGYFGAALAGLPLSMVVQRLGWNWYFTVLTAAAGCGTVLLIPLRKLRTWQSKAKKTADAA